MSSVRAMIWSPQPKPTSRTETDATGLEGDSVLVSLRMSPAAWRMFSRRARVASSKYLMGLPSAVFLLLRLLVSMVLKKMDNLPTYQYPRFIHME